MHRLHSGGTNNAWQRLLSLTREANQTMRASTSMSAAEGQHVTHGHGKTALLTAGVAQQAAASLAACAAAGMLLHHDQLAWK